MVDSEDETRFAVILGRELIRDKIDVQNLLIYRNVNDNKFDLLKALDFDFDDACRQFVFSKNDMNELLFFTDKELFRYNYVTGKKTTLYKYSKDGIEYTLSGKPLFGVFNDR